MKEIYPHLTEILATMTSIQPKTLHLPLDRGRMYLYQFLPVDAVIVKPGLGFPEHLTSYLNNNAIL